MLTDVSLEFIFMRESKNSSEIGMLLSLPIISEAVQILLSPLYTVSMLDDDPVVLFWAVE